MRDQQIREALRTWLGDCHAAEPDTVIREEMNVCMGLARVDFVVVNGHLGGVEIKSDQDTLRRLPNQITVYGRLFDAMTIVTEPRHLAKVRELVPRWWQIVVAKATPLGPQFSVRRRGRPNPAVDGYSVAQLLMREELLAGLRARGLVRGTSKLSIIPLRRRFVELLPLDDVRRLTRESLKACAAATASPLAARCSD